MTAASAVPLASAAAGAGVVALLAWRAGALTPRGGVAAGLVGTAILVGTGWAGGAVLAAFFVSSSAVSRVVRADTAPALDPKGDCRDERQVLANGGAAALGALGARLGLWTPALGLWIVSASLAAAAADTWATAWGARSRRPPRLLLTGRQVPPGTSGGVTPLGTLGGAAGAALVALTGALAGGAPLLLPVAAGIGLGGMLADSALGAAAQGRFHCPRCDRPSEWRVHRCGARTVRTGGFAWLDNDAVNGAATLAAAVAAALAGWAAARAAGA